MSCALECYDIQLDTVVLETQAQLGGQITEIPFHVRNVAGGTYDDQHPLTQALERSAAILGDRARPGWPVEQIDLGERWVESAGRRLAADAIVIATGVGVRRLPAAVDGGFGGDVTYDLGSDLAAIRRPPCGRNRRRGQRDPRRPGSGPHRVPGLAGVPLPSTWLRGRTSPASSATISGSPNTAAGSSATCMAPTDWKRWCWCVMPPASVGRSKPAAWW